MPSKDELRELEEASDAIGGLLAEAVQATVEDRSHEPARQCVGQFLDVDAHAAPEASGGPAQLMATLILVRWLSLARDALADRPDRVGEALDWVGESLGKRYRARSRFVSAVLQDEEGAADVPAFQNALQEEFLPALVWLVAGVVAVHGEGRIGWLHALEAGAPSTASFLG